MLQGEKWEFLLALGGHEDLVSTVGWSPDGARVVSGDDCGLKIWSVCGPDPRRWALLRALGEGVDVRSAAWSPGGGYVVSGGSDGVLRLWDVGCEDAEGWSLAGALQGGGAISFVAWSPCCARVASGGQGAAVRLWSVEGRDPARWRLLEELQSGHEGGVLYIGWSPDGSHLVTGGAPTGQLEFWRADNAEGGRAWDCLGVFGRGLGEREEHASFSGSLDDMWVVSAGLDKKLKLWLVGGSDPAEWAVLKDNPMLKRSSSSVVDRHNEAEIGTSGGTTSQI